MSTPLLEPNVDPPQASSLPRHTSSNSFDATNRRSDTISNGDGDPRTTISASASPEPAPNGPLFLRTGNAVNGRRLSIVGVEVDDYGARVNGFRGVVSEPTSPRDVTGPVGLSLVTTSPNGASNSDSGEGPEQTSPSYFGRWEVYLFLCFSSRYIRHFEWHHRTVFTDCGSRTLYD